MAPHILIYDHDAAILARLSHAFASAGYRVTTCHPGSVRFGQVRSLAPDAIVFGFTLDSPKDDLAFVPQLRAEADLSGLPVFVAMPREHEMRLAFGDPLTRQTEFDVQPFDARPLVDAVRALLPPDAAD